MRRKMHTDYLFAEQATIHDVVRHQEASTNRALDQLVAEVILSQSLEDLTARLMEELSLEVPILDRTATLQLPNEEIEIDVSRDPMRAFLDPSEPFYVKGTAMQIAVPFNGDPELFKYGGSSFGSRIPGRIDGSKSCTDL